MSQEEFIEVKRVLSDKYDRKKNVGSQPETYPVDAIFTFREWHKGDNDKYIEGEMTLIVLRPTKPKKSLKTATVTDGKITEEDKEARRFKTILIEESYESFLHRMSTNHRYVNRAPQS